MELSLNHNVWKLQRANNSYKLEKHNIIYINSRQLQFASMYVITKRIKCWKLRSLYNTITLHSFISDVRGLYLSFSTSLSQGDDMQAYSADDVKLLANVTT